MSEVTRLASLEAEQKHTTKAINAYEEIDSANLLFPRIHGILQTGLVDFIALSKTISSEITQSQVQLDNALGTMFEDSHNGTKLAESVNLLMQPTVAGRFPSVVFSQCKCD